MAAKEAKQREEILRRKAEYAEEQQKLGRVFDPERGVWRPSAEEQQRRLKMWEEEQKRAAEAREARRLMRERGVPL